MKRNIVLVLGLMCMFCGIQKSQAQVNKYLLNIPHHDDKQIHFGFILGMTNNTLDATFSDGLLNSNVTKAEILNFNGFNVGMLADYRLNNNFNLRFVPSLTLTKRAIKFTYTSGVGPFSTIEELQKNDEAALFNLPISLKFRAQRRGNVRPYVFSGAQMVIDMSSDKNVDDPEVLRINSNDFGLHVGLGMDFYLEFFKFGVEMRYVYGLTDLKVNDDSNFYNAIESIHHRGLQFCLTFE